MKKLIAFMMLMAGLAHAASTSQWEIVQVKTNDGSISSGRALYQGSASPVVRTNDTRLLDWTNAHVHVSHPQDGFDAAPADWVRGLLSGGMLLYNITNRNTFNTNWYTAGSTTNDTAQVRSYPGLTSASNDTYLGTGIMTTQKFYSVYSPMAVKTYISWNYNPSRHAHIVPEFYWTTDGTNFVEVSAPDTQELKPNTNTNAYQWIIAFPTITNQLGVLVSRRLKVGEITGTVNIDIHGSGDHASYIAFDTPPSVDSSLGVRGMTGMTYVAGTAFSYDSNTRVGSLGTNNFGGGGSSPSGRTTNSLWEVLTQGNNATNLSLAGVDSIGLSRVAVGAAELTPAQFMMLTAAGGGAGIQSGTGTRLDMYANGLEAFDVYTNYTDFLGQYLTNVLAIKLMADPISDQDAATKKYVDDNINTNQTIWLATQVSSNHWALTNEAAVAINKTLINDDVYHTLNVMSVVSNGVKKFQGNLVCIANSIGLSARITATSLTNAAGAGFQQYPIISTVVGAQYSGSFDVPIDANGNIAYRFPSGIVTARLNAVCGDYGINGTPSTGITLTNAYQGNPSIVGSSDGVTYTWIGANTNIGKSVVYGLSSTQTVTNNVLTYVVWNNFVESLGLHGGMDTNTGIYTFPYAGTYDIVATAGSTAVGTNTRAYIDMRYAHAGVTNTVALFDKRQFAYVEPRICISASRKLTVSAGDTLHTRVLINSNENEPLESANGTTLLTIEYKGIW